MRIITTESFDTTLVYPQTINLKEGGFGKTKWHIDDVDGDGDLNLLLQFSTGEFDFPEGATELCLIGLTYEGKVVEGCDSIKQVP